MCKEQQLNLVSPNSYWMLLESPWMSPGCCQWLDKSAQSYSNDGSILPSYTAPAYMPRTSLKVCNVFVYGLLQLQLRAQELEQQNSSLRQKCKALEHLLAHQDLMAGMQEQICIQEHTLAAEYPASGSCSRSVDIAVTQQLLQDQWAHNPLLQCFQSTADPTSNIAVRHSSPQDIAQSWLLLLSNLSLALHCHDMHPEQVQSSSMLCRAVTDCNRFIAAVNLLQEEIWPQVRADFCPGQARTSNLTVVLPGTTTRQCVKTCVFRSRGTAVAHTLCLLPFLPNALLMMSLIPTAPKHTLSGVEHLTTQGTVVVVL
jgi:hypothetical protein